MFEFIERNIIIINSLIMMKSDANPQKDFESLRIGIDGEDGLVYLILYPEQFLIWKVPTFILDICNIIYFENL